MGALKKVQSVGLNLQGLHPRGKAQVNAFLALVKLTSSLVHTLYDSRIPANFRSTSNSTYVCFLENIGIAMRKVLEVPK